MKPSAHAAARCCGSDGPVDRGPPARHRRPAHHHQSGARGRGWPTHSIERPRRFASRAPETDAAAVRSRDAAEIADLKATINHLAQQAQRMAMHDAEKCRAIDTLRAALADTTAGKIVPFPAVVSH